MRRRFSLLALFATATLPLLVVLAQTSDAPTCEIVAPDLGSYIGDWCAIWIRVDDPQGPQTVENVTLTVTTSPPKSKSFVYTTSRYNDTFFYANLSLPYGRLELTATAVDDSGLQGSHTIWVIHPFPVPYFNSFDTPTIHFFESWGEDLTNWTISPAGTWHVNYSNYHSPPSCFYTGPFSGPITITLVSPPINLTNWTGEAFLSFWSKINQTPSFTIPPTDYCCVEVSTDGRTWYLLSPYIVGYWSWSFFGRYSLTKYVGRIIYLRFKLVASSSGGGAGWWLDDIIVGNEKKVLVLDKLVKHFSCDSLDEWTYSGDWSVCTSTYHSYPSCICCGSFSGNKRYTITSPRISIPSVGSDQDIYLRLWWKFLIDQDCRVVVQLYYDGLWHSIGEFRSSLKRWRSSSFWITQTSEKRIKIRFMVEGYSSYASFQGLWFDDVTILVFNRRIATKGNITGWFSTENSLWRVTPIRCYSYNFSLWWGDTSTCLCYYGVSYPLDLWVDLRDADHAYIRFHAYWNFTDPQSCASLRVCYDESEWVLLDTFMGARSSWTTRQYRINGGCVVRIRFQVEVYSSYAIGFFVDDFAVLPTTSDTASPNVSIIEPKSGAWFNFTNITCVWQGEDDVGVCEYEVRVDGSFVAVELPPTTTNYTLSLSSEGLHTVEVRAYDCEGNGASAQTTFGIDLSPPDIDVLAPVSNSCISTTSITVEWSGEDLSGIRYYLVSLDEEPFVNVSQSTSYTFENLAEGWHFVRIVGVDLAGNVGEATTSFYVDTHAPQIQIITPSNGSFTNASEIFVQWDAVDNYAIDYYELYVNDQLVLTNYMAMNWTLSNLSEGVYNVTVVAFDLAGNYNSSNVLFTVDKTSPLITAQLVSSYYTNQTYAVICWNSSDNFGLYRIEVRIDSVLTNVSTLEAGECVVPLSGEGEHSIAVSAVDFAGNRETALLAVVVDTTPPELRIVNPQNGSSFYPSDTISIEWEASDNTEIAYYLVFINEQLHTNTTATHLSLANLTAGQYIIQVAAYDVAGNVRRSAVSITVLTPTTGAAPKGGVGLYLPIVGVALLAAASVSLAVVLLRKRRRSGESE